MNSTELTKLAQSDPQVAEALLTLVKEATDATQFSESIPSLAQANGGAGSPATTSGSQPAQLGQPGQGQPPMQDANAQAMQMAGNSPGVDAAKAFLADAFTAAAQGDQNAQMTIAMTAAQIAKAEAGNAAPSAAPASPEAAAADQIVADPNAAPAGAPGVVAPAAAPAAAPAPATEAAPTQAVVADATPPAEQAAQAGEAVGEAKGKEEGKKTGKEEVKKEEKKDEKGGEKKKPPFMEKKSSYTPEDVATIVQLVRDGIL